MSWTSWYWTGRQSGSLLQLMNVFKLHLHHPDVLRVRSCYGYLCNEAPTDGQWSFCQYQIKCFFRYFDPVKMYVDKKLNNFRGDLTNTSAKKGSLQMATSTSRSKPQALHDPPPDILVMRTHPEHFVWVVLVRFARWMLRESHGSCICGTTWAVTGVRTSRLAS